jgi:hypothetical protein
VPRPGGVDAFEGLVVLGDDEHLVGAADAANADEPVREEGEVGPENSREENCAAARGGGCLLERVGPPRGGWGAIRSGALRV